MKKFLTTSAVALIASAGSASAQESVLERVLGQIDNSTNVASVNGTFANIAENIGGAGTQDAYTNGTLTITPDEYSALLSEAKDAAYEEAYEAPTVVTTTLTAEPQTTDDKYIIDDGEGGTMFDEATYDADTAEWETYQSYLTAVETAEGAAQAAADAVTAVEGYTETTLEIPGLLGVDGSINTTVTGVSDAISAATQSATSGDAVAYEFNLPTLNIGDLSTTALGAVNTGDITLGVNSVVDEAKTTSTQAVSSVMTQLGGSDGTGALVLNIASNMTGVNGSITTTMADVNGTINSAATTALGAVNTGTIVSGVDAAVQGIVGVSGQ